jgi:FkbM family methyltransferase
MDDIVSSHLQRIGLNGDVSLVLHLGAGACQELPTYLAMGATRIHLLEPNPTVAKALLRLAEAEPSVTVDARAVAGQDGLAALHVFNFAPLSSLRLPTGLRELMPGLHEVDSPEVETVSVASLMEDLEPLEGHGARVLVIDAPGEEGRILIDLQVGGFLRRFSHILLYFGRVSLFAGSPIWDELSELVLAEGYRVEGCSDTDPDRPCLLLRLDTLALEVTALTTALAEARTKTNADAAEYQRLLAETQDLKSDLEIRNGRISALMSELEKSDGEARAARQDLSLAMRNHALVQGDLRDLQAQYQQVNNLRARQEDLLRRLTHRLGDAAQVLQSLSPSPLGTVVMPITKRGKSESEKAGKPARETSKRKTSAAAGPGASVK